jgi:WD40 repeat protein
VLAAVLLHTRLTSPTHKRTDLTARAGIQPRGDTKTGKLQSTSAPAETVKSDPKPEPPPGGDARGLIFEEVAPVEVKVGWIRAVAISDDGRYMAVGGEWPRAQIWDLHEQKVVRTINFKETPESIAFAPNGHVAALSYFMSPIKVVDLAEKQSDRTYIGHNDDGSEVGFSPDGKFLVSSALNTWTKLFLDAGTGQLVKSIDIKDRTAEPVFSRSNRYMAVSTGDSGVQIWDVIAGSRVAAIPSGSWAGTAFSGDEKFIAVQGKEAGTATIWTVSPVQEKNTVRIPADKSADLVMRDDRNELICGTFKGVFVVDLVSGKTGGRAYSPKTQEPYLSHSRDGDWWVVGDYDKVHVFHRHR